MKVQEYFNDEFSYAYSIEAWIEKYFKSVNFELEYTFASDLAIVDWFGNKEEVKESYNSIKNSWIDDYKAFTEVVMCVNMLSWANDQLLKHSFDDREEWVDFYSDLYYQARDDFYSKYENNEEACNYFFKCTD